MQPAPIENNSRQGNHLSARPEGALASARTVNSKLPTSTCGRTELAQMYFPHVLPQTAWQKLRSLLAEDPALSHLTKLRRRTFLPSEVAKIYTSLGHP